MIKLTKEELAIIGESRYMKQYRIKMLIALMVSSVFVVIGMGITHFVVEDLWVFMVSGIPLLCLGCVESILESKSKKYGAKFVEEHKGYIDKELVPVDFA